MFGPPEEQGLMSRAIEGTNMVRSESMEISNDPRFFQDNVIDKRLAAFGCLAVVSGLLAESTMDHAFPMKKDMGFNLEGMCQLLSFLLLSLVFFSNMLGTYVGVAQPYHTYRLMTAGPTGFEAATMYYLDQGIILWRHMAIKLMLYSLPLYIVAHGLRMIPMFDRVAANNDDIGKAPETIARLQGFFFMSLYLGVAIALFYVHWVHEAVFRFRYDSIAGAPGLTNMVAEVKGRMSRAARTGFVTTPDV
jgi:hypothetical protein